MGIELTTDQKLALYKLMNWYKGSRQFFTLSGVAGSGKSTLISHFTDLIKLIPGEYAYATYTGKAANVLNSKGVPAVTIHHLIYDYIGDDDDGQPIYERKENLGSVKLVIIDEYSMIGKRIFKDLRKFDVRIILVGDDAQLQPVGDQSIGIFTPDVNLTEIMRQAEQSPIVYLSKMIRDGKHIGEGFISNEVGIIRRKDVTDQLLMSNEFQILCGYNETRSALNDKIRALKDYTDLYPQPGESVICTANNWRLMTDTGMPLTNGTICSVIDSRVPMDDTCEWFEMTLQDKFFNYNKDKTFTVQCNRWPFQGGYEWTRDLESFEFGYAITVHKAQGSEWDNVIVFNEPIGDKKKWLYTAITRAKKGLLIVNPD